MTSYQLVQCFSFLKLSGVAFGPLIVVSSFFPILLSILLPYYFSRNVLVSKKHSLLMLCLEEPTFKMPTFDALYLEEPIFEMSTFAELTFEMPTSVKLDLGEPILAGPISLELTSLALRSLG